MSDVEFHFHLEAARATASETESRLLIALQSGSDEDIQWAEMVHAAALGRYYGDEF